MQVKKLSFASADQTLEASGMEIGGVTPFGLPPEIWVSALECGCCEFRSLIR
jgi:prolyl-tRNA editing enzyme YbaK/EbsC (Cys-tRNA(Pro) deacylase)